MLRAGDGTDAPVFAIHPAGGLGWCYAGLLPFLPPTTGVYALQADGLDGSPLPLIADRRRARLPRHHRGDLPTGPLRLVGWSVGG